MFWFLDLAGRRGRRKPERREERDRPLPPLLARVGGNIEVSIFFILGKKFVAKRITTREFLINTPSSTHGKLIEEI